MKHRAVKKTMIFGIGLLFLVLPTLAAMLGETHEEPFEKTVGLARDGKVLIHNISGDIEVRTWSEGQVKIKALKTSRAGSLSQAKENAARVSIEIIEEGNTLRIETKYPRNLDRFWGRESVNVSVDYWLWIPDKASFRAKNISGDIDVEGAGGDLDLDAVSGDLHLRQISGRVEGNTVSGDIKGADIVGGVWLKSVSGDISMTAIKGSIEAETVSGDVELSGVSEANKVAIKALSGEVVYRGSINPAGNYSLKSHSGNVTLYLPADSAFDLDAGTFSGSIRTDFEIKVTGKVSGREMSGTVNSGGATVKLSSFSGDIKIIKS